MKKNKISFRPWFFLMPVLLFASPVFSQLGKLKEKVNQAIQTENKGSEQPVKVKTSEQSVGKVESPANVEEPSINEKNQSNVDFDAIQKQYRSGSINIVSNEDSKPDMTPIPGFLTFTNDFWETNADQTLFSGKDFVYANLKLPKKLTEYLPPADDQKLEYYRIVIKAWPEYDKYRDVESNLKLHKKSDFPLAYHTDQVLFGILPAQEFYDHFADKYKKDEKFTSSKEAVNAYSDLLAHPIVFEIAEMLKDAPEGRQIIHVKIEITAKMSGSGFRRLEDIRGAFQIDLDNEAKERYAGIVANMGEYKLSNYYHGELSIANQTISEADEAEMLKSMSPRDRERYQIAKRSPDGYMAAYKGPKASITVQMDAQRTKEAKIWISWPDGGEGKEAGNSSFMLFPNVTRSKTKEIPVGATVTINGRTLIPKVVNNQNVTVYWYY